MSALTEIMHDLFAPRPVKNPTFVEGVKMVGCGLVLLVMFVAMVAPWVLGAWLVLSWIS